MKIIQLKKWIDIETLECTTEWKLDNRRHREDGPAVIFPDGDAYYYELGHWQKFQKRYLNNKG